MRAIAWGFYGPHHFNLNSEVPHCIFVFPPLLLSLAWGCCANSSSSRIFFLKYGTCVSRKYLLGRVSNIRCFVFFCVFLCFSSNRFPKKKLREIGVQKDRFLFSSPHFYLKDWKTDFLKDITSDKKKVVISSTSKNSSTFRKLI